VVGWCKLECGVENRNSQANRRCFRGWSRNRDTTLSGARAKRLERSLCHSKPRESPWQMLHIYHRGVVLYNIFGIDGFPSELLSFERNMRSCMFIYCTLLYWAMQRPQRRRSKHLPNSLEFSMIITFSQGCSINKDMQNSSFLFPLRKCVDFIGKYGV
jgi:hypothetical protein